MKHEARCVVYSPRIFAARMLATMCLVKCDEGVDEAEKRKEEWLVAGKEEFRRPLPALNHAPPAGGGVALLPPAPVVGDTPGTNSVTKTEKLGSGIPVSCYIYI